MGVTHQSEIQLGRIHSPLTLSPGITVQGNVPDVQQYDIAANVYEPDYTLTNLVLVPAMEVSDPDGIIADGQAALTNMKWTLIENGAQTQITTSTPGFAVGSDGKLTVKRNCNGQNPMTFRFEADFLDTRTGEVYRMLETHMVDCEGVSERPVLSLDTSGLIAYDPVRDGELTRKVKASLSLNGQEVPAARREFVWQKRDYDGVWADIDGSDIMDYDVELNADKTELTVRLWLIGERIDIRCYAKYSPYGSPSSVAIDNRTPVETLSAKRVEGRLRGVVKSARLLKSGVKSISPELAVMDSKGVIPNPDSVLDIEWRTSTGTASGAVNRSAVAARGSKPTIPTSFIDNRYGGKLIPAFGAKDALAALTDSDGAILVDDDGSVIVG